MKASITVDDPKKIIAKCFASEDKIIPNKARYKLNSKVGKTVFDIEAKNSIGLRIVLNSITKMLTVIEKMAHNDKVRRKD